MAKRRAPKVIWLPPNTFASVGQQGPGSESSWKRIVVSVTGVTGDTAVGEVPLVIDGADDATSLQNSIADLYASSYRLRRIVGKIFVSARVGLDPQNLPPRVLGVTAGIIVRRTDPVSGQSFAGLTGNSLEFNPSLIANSNDPWIWRRSWILVNRTPSVSVSEAGEFPAPRFDNYASNGASALDGPHIDQKTARVIGPEERLFMDIGVTILHRGDAGDDGEADVDIVYDLRYVVSLRSSSGNRRNASR